MLHSTILPNEYMVLVWNPSPDDNADKDASRLGLKKIKVFGGNVSISESLKKIISQRK